MTRSYTHRYAVISHPTHGGLLTKYFATNYLWLARLALWWYTDKEAVRTSFRIYKHLGEPSDPPTWIDITHVL